jgi:hypothetical protein
LTDATLAMPITSNQSEIQGRGFLVPAVAGGKVVFNVTTARSATGISTGLIFVVGD